MALEEKNWVLITGCTPGGIGHALSLEFASRGFHVLSTVRDPSRYGAPHPNVRFLALEVTSPESIARLKDEVIEITGGKLSILYNNAGRNYTVPALDVEFEEVQETFEVNVFSVMRICQALAPLLIAAKGTIVQTGSLAATMPYVFAATYNASKAALHLYSDTLRVEMAPLGVKVITIITGGVKSNIARTERSLPADSYYIPLSVEYARRLKYSQELGMDTKQYAKNCVNKILRGKGWLSQTRWVWEGKMSWIVRSAHLLLPLSVFDWYFWQVFKLWKLKPPSDDKKRV